MLDDYLNLLKKLPEQERREFEMRAFGAPTMSWEIQNDMQRADSFIKQTAANFVTRFVGEREFEIIAQKVALKLAQEREVLQRRSPTLSKASSTEDSSKNTTIKDLQNRLDRTIDLKKSLYQERNDLIQPMVKEWRDYQAQRVNDFTANLAREGIILSDNERALLNTVRTGQEMLLTHPELIPAGPQSNEQAIRLGNLHTELLGRVIEVGRTTGQEPQQVQSIAASLTPAGQGKTPFGMIYSRCAQQTFTDKDSLSEAIEKKQAPTRRKVFTLEERIMEDLIRGQLRLVVDAANQFQKEPQSPSNSTTPTPLNMKLDPFGRK